VDLRKIGGGNDCDTSVEVGARMRKRVAHCRNGMVDPGSITKREWTERGKLSWGGSFGI
jgi:hypothetical protein